MSTEKNKNVIITKKAREKMVKARAGAAALPKITGMAFGNGGTEADGTVKPPADTQEELYNELLRKEISGYTFPEDTVCRYECTGEEISEVGLYDEDGDIVCMKTFMRKGKDDDVEQTYTLDDIF